MSGRGTRGRGRGASARVVRGTGRGATSNASRGGSSAGNGSVSKRKYDTDMEARNKRIAELESLLKEAQDKDKGWVTFQRQPLQNVVDHNIVVHCLFSQVIYELWRGSSAANHKGHSVPLSGSICMIVAQLPRAADNANKPILSSYIMTNWQPPLWL